MKYLLLIISIFGVLNASAQTSDEAEILRLCLEFAGHGASERTIEVQIADSLAPLVQEIKGMDVKLVPAPTNESILIEMVRQHPDTFKVKLRQSASNFSCTVVRQADGWQLTQAVQKLIPND